MQDPDSILPLIDDDEVVQVARDLVAIPSITTKEGHAMNDYFLRWFGDLGIPCREYEASGGRANFFADYGAVSGPGSFLFNGHHDTKPVDGMTVDPFGGKIVDGRMYGRGACDMKGGIAAFLCAVKAHVRSGAKLAGGVTFYSDFEEEYGGPDGMMAMINAGRLDGFDGMISCEPSQLEVHIGDRGGIASGFETRGRSAHSGLAHLGVNAIHNMVLFISEFRKLPYTKKTNPHFGPVTVNFEKIEGGLYLSAVPDRCVACLDSRLVPETPHDEVLAEIDGLIERLNREHGANIRRTDPPKEWRPKAAAYSAQYIETDHPLARRAAGALEAVMGKPPAFAACAGTTLAGRLIQRGTPAVICGPGSILQAHTDDEWVAVDHLTTAARVYAHLLAGM